MDNHGQPHQRSIVTRSLAVWLLIISAEIAHGIVRGLILVPAVGEFRSNQIGVFSGAIIVLVMALVFVKWLGATTYQTLLLVGLLWTSLTFAFEILLGRIVIGLSWQRLWADYNVPAGGLMPIGLIVLCLSPVIAGRLRGIVGTN
jgi:hypothetical protein